MSNTKQILFCDLQGEIKAVDVSKAEQLLTYLRKQAANTQLTINAYGNKNSAEKITYENQMQVFTKAIGDIEYQLSH